MTSAGEVAAPIDELVADRERIRREAKRELDGTR
jgi:hypothetical protein